MKWVSLLHELKHGQNLNEFSIEDTSHCTREKQLFPLREKRRATRDHLGFCVGTEGGKCRTNECEFAWEIGRRKQAVMRKQIKPAPCRPLRERRGTPLAGALHCSSRDLSTQCLLLCHIHLQGNRHCQPGTVHSLLPLKILWI